MKNAWKLLIIVNLSKLKKQIQLKMGTETQCSVLMYDGGKSHQTLFKVPVPVFFSKFRGRMSLNNTGTGIIFYVESLVVGREFSQWTGRTLMTDLESVELNHTFVIHS